MSNDPTRPKQNALSVTAEEEQRQFFERLATRYDGRFCRTRWPRNQQLKARVIAEALGSAAIDGPVVELGCGTGQVAGELLALRTKLHYVGLDLSPAMLELARLRLDRHGDRVDLREVHGSLPLESSSFAGGFGIDVLHHLERPQEVLEQLHNALTPGAPIVFLEGNPRFPLTTLIALVYRDERGLFGMTFRNLRAWLGAAGFESVSVEYGPLYTPPGPTRIEPALDRVDLALARVPGIRSLAIFYTAQARAAG